MMKKSGIALLLALCVLAFSANAFAWRCGNLIVKKGTQKAAVSLYCGTPEYRDYSGSKTEIWYYGPQSGVYRLVHMRYGEVTKVEMKRKP